MEQIGSFLGNITNTLGQIGTQIGSTINGWIQNGVNPVENIIGTVGNLLFPGQPQTPTPGFDTNALATVIGSQINSFLSNPIASLTNSVNSIYGGITNQIGGLYNGISGLLGNMTSSIGGQFFNGIQGLVGGIDSSLGTITQAIAPAITPLTSAINSVIGLIPQNIRDSINGVIQGLGNVISPLSQGLSNAVNNIGTLFTQAGSSQAQQIANAIQLAQQSSNNAINAVNSSITTALGEQGQLISDINTGLGSGIDKIVNSLLHTVTNVEGDIASWWINFERKAQSFISDKFQYAAQQLDAPIGHLQEITGKLIHGEYNSFNDLLADFTVNANNAGLVDALIQIAYLVSSTMAISSAIGGVTGKAVNRLFEQDTKLELLSPDNYITLMKYDVANASTYQDYLYKLGYSDEQINNLLVSSKQTLNFNQLLTLLRYGKIDDTGITNYLTALNYQQSEIDLLMGLLFNPIPFSSYVDNLRRGLYDDSYVNSFGLNIGKPSDLYDRAKANGLSQDNADRMYYASFNHPSIEQAKEMYLRGLIDETTYDQLIRYSGIAPKFIDAVKGLSNSLLTRRDIKSLHSLGNLTTQQVYQQFRKLGYDDNDATLLTNYTVQYDEENHPFGLQKSKVLTESIIKDAYLRRLKDEQTTLTELQNIGYSTNDATFLLAVWNYDLHKTVNTKVEQTHTQKAITNVQNAFLKFTITEQELLSYLQELGYSLANAQEEMLLLEIDRNLQEKEKIEELIISAYDNYRLDISEVTSKLTQFGFSSEEISAILVKAQLHRELKTTKISIADLDKLLKKQIITPDDYQNQLRAHGYDEVSVSWLSQLAGITYAQRSY